MPSTAYPPSLPLPTPLAPPMVHGPWAYVLPCGDNIQMPPPTSLQSMPACYWPPPDALPSIAAVVCGVPCDEA
ncbi:hypothetical protein E2562_001124 [Oryza meyeriana var. granulata]|uniref:Uncharacterized protein n=1 Tax=Oryza meyeriana var. granulata TaxID=110450 RepID=A0A6G1EE96_9ORYZ|nr:hypothetical protein E2562_001124 [Oryza meyeriana var. granulata]